MSQSCTERAKSGSSYRKRRNPVRNGVADWQKHCGTAAGLIPKPAATAGSAAWSFHGLHLRFRCCQSTSCSQILLIIHGPTYAQNNKRAHWGQSGTRQTASEWPARKVAVHSPLILAGWYSPALIRTPFYGGVRERLVSKASHGTVAGIVQRQVSGI